MHQFSSVISAHLASGANGAKARSKVGLPGRLRKTSTSMLVSTSPLGAPVSQAAAFKCEGRTSLPMSLTMHVFEEMLTDVQTALSSFTNMIDCTLLCGCRGNGTACEDGVQSIMLPHGAKHVFKRPKPFGSPVAVRCHVKHKQCRHLKVMSTAIGFVHNLHSPGALCSNDDAWHVVTVSSCTGSSTRAIFAMTLIDKSNARFSVQPR